MDGAGEHSAPRAKVRLLLTASGDPAALRRTAAARLAGSAATDDITLAWGVRCPGDVIAGTAHGAAIGPAPAGFEVLVEATSVVASTAQLVESLAPILDDLAPQTDRARSSILAGREHLLAPNFGRYLMVFALRRRADLSPETFVDDWANRHGPMVMAGFGRRGSYYQFHGDAGATSAAAARLGLGVADYDGHAGGWLRDPAVLQTSMRHEGAQVALDDERRFIDHARSMLLVYDTVPDD